jgi:hypothetical protein
MDTIATTTEFMEQGIVLEDRKTSLKNMLRFRAISIEFMLKS